MAKPPTAAISYEENFYPHYRITVKMRKEHFVRDGRFYGLVLDLS